MVRICLENVTARVPHNPEDELCWRGPAVTDMYKIDVAGGEPVLVCKRCLDNEQWFAGEHVRCPGEVAGARCSNSTHADAPTGSLHRAIRQRRAGGSDKPTIYKMVIVQEA